MEYIPYVAFVLSIPFVQTFLQMMLQTWVEILHEVTVGEVATLLQSLTLSYRPSFARSCISDVCQLYSTMLPSFYISLARRPFLLGPLAECPVPS